MSSSLVTHKSIHPLSSSIWGRDSKRFSHEAKLGGWPHLRSRGAGVATAYLEPEPNPVSQFFKNVQGSLPIVGLLSRLLNDEGGIGNDRIQPVEFAARVQKNCSYKASQAFYEFQERHGPVCFFTPSSMLNRFPVKINLCHVCFLSCSFERSKFLFVCGGVGNGKISSIFFLLFFRPFVFDFLFLFFIFLFLFPSPQFSSHL